MKMILTPRIILPTLALLVLLKGRSLRVVCYIHPLAPVTSTTSRARRNAFFRLHSSPNIFTGRTSTSMNDDDDGDEKNKYNSDKRNIRRNKIEFVNFWGTKINSDDEAEMLDPRIVPFVSTLDVRDGPLPRGAHILEGKAEFDAKPTCRITIDVVADNIDASDDVDALVRKLQDCIDAGFDTFRLHDQTPRSLAIIRKMNQNTPSNIQRHWTVDLKITHSENPLSLKSDLRQSVLDLVEQTGGDALDSLKIDCDNLYANNALMPDEMVLEIFEHLVDLQREGWIRSMGVGNIKSEKLRRDLTTYFGDRIDFEEREGNLLLPIPGLHKPKNNLRMSNALAGGLLTDLYNINDRRRGKNNLRPSTDPELQLTNDNMKLLKEWSNRRHEQQTSTWKEYQDDVVSQLDWIALKHDVSISAIALRWALECGDSAATGGLGEEPIVSSVLAEIDFDDPKGDFAQKLIELRQVFRFQLDEEDKEILDDITASLHDHKHQDNGDGFPDIDFNNPALWL